MEGPRRGRPRRLTTSAEAGGAADTLADVLHLVFVNPVIPPNTGNAIRLSAVTGAHLHLIEPLGFTMDDANLRRAGLDYHDLATVTVHAHLDALWDAVLPARVFAYTAHATTRYVDIDYRDDDVLMFGTEPTGLPDEVLQDAHVTDRVRIPMIPGRRSLNLANSASIVLYEAWRQLGFVGAQ